MSHYHQHLIPGKESTDIKQFVLDPNFYNQNLTGFYRGIVLQNNDPERRGRVKIFIPAFSPHIYNEWLDKKDNEFTNKKFRFSQGSNLNKEGCSDKESPSLKQIAEKAKNILDWAEQASCLIGIGTSGLYGFEKPSKPGKSTISDASTPDRFPASDNAQCTGDGNGGANVDNIGERGGHKHEIDDAAHDLQDGFVSLEEDKMPEVNTFAKVYKPAVYSNKVKGAFSIPGVGSMVWVFFENGDIARPIYFAYSYDKSDWQSIYDVTDNNGPNYPGAFENTSVAGDDNIYKKGKTVFNSKAGAIEFIDTDEYEQIKITQHGGSFIQLSNKAAVYYADKNEQKLVAGDQFETVNQIKNLRVKKSYNVGVDENRWTRIGFWNTQAYNDWVNENKIIADTRARFPIKRATKQAASGCMLPQGSTKQERKGTFDANPCCTNERTPVVVSPGISSVYNQIPKASAATGNECSTLATATTPVKSNDSHVERLSLTPTEFQKAAGDNGSKNFSGNPALSPSTENGKWEPDTEYNNINQLESAQAQKMIEYETKFGTGGDDITEITRHKFDIIGAAFNDSPCIRVDSIGRINFNEVLISSKGAFASRKPSPLVERVSNDGKFPCGNYTLTVGNNFSVVAGSGGIQMQTLGCIDVAGQQIVIAGANELLMSSSGDIKIASDSKFEVTADIIAFRQKDGKQIGIDGSLGIKNNLIVAGGAYIEGELCVNHVTAPVEIQETESMRLFGTTVTGKIIGYVNDNDGGGDNWLPVYGGITPGGVADADCIENVSHSHNFKNLPLTLKQNNEGVRNDAAAMNKGNNQVAASPVHNGMKIIS